MRPLSLIITGHFVSVFSRLQDAWVNEYREKTLAMDTEAIKHISFRTDRKSVV